MAKVSICIPIYGMANGQELLKRNLESILAQNYKDYEIVVSDDSDNDMFKTWLKKYPIKYFKNLGKKGMANNTNYAMDKASGELIKILFQDDFFYKEDSLEEIIKHFTSTTYWLVTSCLHTTDGINLVNLHEPYYSESDNTIGSPSVLTIRRNVLVRFDPEFHWVLDLDFYKQCYRAYGKPKILNKANVVIGIHPGQKTFLLSDSRKILEHQQLRQKYD